MNPIKKLASQTAIYGVSSIIGRFLNYLLVPLYTRFFSTAEYGVISEFYAYSGFLIVLLTFGMETAVFRFAKDESSTTSQSTILRFLLSSSSLFIVCIAVLSPFLATQLHYQGYEYYFVLFAFILGADALGAVPFASLRLDERPTRFAFVKLTEIAVNIGLNLLFVFAKQRYDAGVNSGWSIFYDPSIGVGYIFIANLISSLVKLILLSDLFYKIGISSDFTLLKKIIRYSLPMVIIGFAGIINEMLDRSMMKFLLPGTVRENLSQLGIYSACYKISIVMSLFIQAFRFAAEPYFFSIYKSENSRQVYADVMDWFVWFCTGIFIVVTVFLDEFGLFVGKDFRVGLNIVPILLLANLLLGIYVNLSIWYKLTDRTMLGAGVSIFGAGITVILLYILVPLYGYTGAAWTTLICYALMAITSYLLGKKYFSVPYRLGNMVIFILLCIGIWLLSSFVFKTNSINVYVWKSAMLITGISVLTYMKFSDVKKMVFKK